MIAAVAIMWAIAALCIVLCVALAVAVVSAVARTHNGFTRWRDSARELKHDPIPHMRRARRVRITGGEL